MLGPISSAPVKAYVLNADGTTGSLLESTTTDENGNWSMNASNLHGLILFSVGGGGQWWNEATGAYQDFGADEIYNSVSTGPTSGTKVVISSLTHIAYLSAVAAMQAGQNPSDSIKTALLVVAQAAGMPPGTDISSLIPANTKTAPSGGSLPSAAETAYGLILAGIAELAANKGVSHQDLVTGFGKTFSGAVAPGGRLSEGGGTIGTSADWSDLSSAIMTWWASIGNQAGLDLQDIPAPVPPAPPPSQPIYYALDSKVDGSSVTLTWSPGPGSTTASSFNLTVATPSQPNTLLSTIEPASPVTLTQLSEGPYLAILKLLDSNGFPLSLQAVTFRVGPAPSVAARPNPTVSGDPTPTPTATQSPTPTPTPSATPTPTPSSTASATPTPTPSSTPSPTPSTTPSPTPTPSRTPSPTPTPTPTPSRTPSPTPTPTPSTTPSPTPTPSTTPSPTPTPSTTPVASNAPGSLDSSFGGTGLVTTAVSSQNDYAYAAAVQADGKIVVAGDSVAIKWVAGSASNFHVGFLARFLPDGTLDSSFGGTGMVPTSNFPGVSVNSCLGLTIQSDGQIVVGCSVNTNPSSSASTGVDFGILRYNPDGTPDSNFGAGGLAYASAGLKGTSMGDALEGVALQSDGKILAVGFAYTGSAPFVNQNLTVLRFNSDGTPDTSFNGTGYAISGLSNSGTPEAGVGFSVAVQPDGKIVAGGYSNEEISYSGTPMNGSAFFAVRYNEDGTLDTGFGSGGMAPSIFGTYNANVGNALALQANGNIVMVGNCSQATPTQGPEVIYTCASRLTSAGVLDPSFGGNGWTVGASGLYFAAAVQTDGRIIAAGTQIGRFNTDGTSDLTFNGTGQETLPFSKANGIALQQDGKIVIVGRAYTGTKYNLAIARYWP